MLQQNWVTVCCLFVLMGFVGCSGGRSENPDWPERIPVSGVVTYQGDPVEGAEVTFTNTAASSTGAGKTDSGGRFYLTTYVERDGVVPGQQAVAIRCVEVIDNTPEGTDLSAGGVAATPEVKWLVPKIYSNSSKSGLSADVSEAGTNEFTFDLK
ncbi:carboxypeptidase-like regulatory domain-containing protein [Aureliella helgolandensis]|uniref:Carboxypeptidase regulatory-like domain-containing protein n=1 Tax=Aureliella helgolandensis TaxID=2527968 RepID=A0A518G2G0_9BACT|nr:carboxypeptidase-like regulatory domain-containing protein [Aureliella helgolandensis]QDV22729.1 hypothetical protein Q31a_10150 [Aureliella helgolandensis]